MPKGFDRDIARILSAHGFTCIKGGKSPHEKWRDANGLTFIVPRNLYSRHTANSVPRAAGIERKA